MIGAPAAPPAAAPSPPARRAVAARWPVVAVACIAAVSAAAGISAMRHQSTTFDEILMPSAGARGFETGRFDLVLDHPPVAQYLYGLPVWLSGVQYPDETEARFTYGSRYAYAQLFFWNVGNDPERVAFLARLAGVATAVLLVLLVFAFTRRYWGDVAGVFAAGATAFLPDVLAHGGIAYNDVPMAVAFLAAVWALDAAARRPSARSVALAAFASGLALGVKFSAIALAPVAVLLVMAEALTRTHDRRAYLLSAARQVPLFIAVVYVTTVAVYLGDFGLADFRFGFEFNVRHARAGHGVPAWLLGHTHPVGFWYFFPVGFVLKTPAALHILLMAALLGFSRRTAGQTSLLRSRLRAPMIGGAVFLVFLMQANLNIGFRHALPLLPLLMVVLGVGVGHLWARSRTVLRSVLVALLVAAAASVLSFHPNFIAYTSEYIGDRDAGYTALVDSSLDWGQGLLQLRAFMREEGVEIVYLSYFGSAWPEGYGIRHVPLASFFPLRPQPAADREPRFLAISATNLAGTYLGDVFAQFRTIAPYRVLGHSMFVFDLRPAAAGAAP